jgi:hypothetical protein
MASADVSAVTARIVTRIQSVSDVGLVWEHDVFSRRDLRQMLVSTIAGSATLRAWWITGPTMSARKLVQRPGGSIERVWRYSIHGVAGLSDDGDSVLTLRNLAVSVCDAIDLDETLGGAAIRTAPCEWAIAPENRAAFAGIGASYVAITKTVTTVSTP